MNEGLFVTANMNRAEIDRVFAIINNFMDGEGIEMIVEEE